MFGNSLFGGLPITTSTSGDTYMGSSTIQLVENRANEIQIPYLQVGSVETRLMEWQDSTNTFITSSTPTRISEFVKQINKRYLGSSVLNSTVVDRIETIDADSGNLFVFVPGTTSPTTNNNFSIIIPDQEGGYESRGFTVFLKANANSSSTDGGEVFIRLTNNVLPF